MTATAPTKVDGAEGAQASATAAAEPSGAAPKADFLQRARENPEWAAEQVTQFQSTADRAEAATKKLVDKIGSMDALLEEFGADTVKAAVENYRNVRNHPDFAEWVPEFEQTGQLPTRTGSEPKVDDGEYKTPEEQELISLRAEVAGLRQDTNANTMASGEQVLTKHMEKVFGEYGLAPEDAEKMRATMVSQMKSWATSGEPGKAALKTLMSPNGYKTVQGIMLSELSPEILHKAATNAALRKHKGLSGLATDGPSGSPGTGTEPPPEFDSIIDAAKWARANPEGHDSN